MYAKQKVKDASVSMQLTTIPWAIQSIGRPRLGSLYFNQSQTSGSPAIGANSLPAEKKIQKINTMLDFELEATYL